MGILSNIMSGVIKDPKNSAELDGGVNEEVPARLTQANLLGGLDPILHPRKGWRRGARPRGTNKRRVLSPAMKASLHGEV